MLDFPGMGVLSGISIREAGLSDIPEILRHRRGMYEAMGYNDTVALTGMANLTTGYLPKAMSEGRFRGWMAVAGERVVGGGWIEATEPA